MPKKLWGITSHWPQWPSSKRSTKNNYCRECTENKILPQSWWDINGEAMMENSMEVPWNTKHRGTVWSCNSIPQCRCRENHHSKWHVYLDFQGSTVYNSQDNRIHQNVHWQKNEDYVVHLYTEMLFSHKTEQNNDIGSSLDIPRNYHTIHTFQREKDKYPKISCTVESISSYQWTNLQNRNRLTDWENQIMTIKGKLEGTGKFGMKIYTLIYIKLIMKKDLLNITGDSTEQTNNLYEEKTGKE